jgi:hypothetical protein
MADPYVAGLQERTKELLARRNSQSNNLPRRVLLLRDVPTKEMEENHCDRASQRSPSTDSTATGGVSPMSTIDVLTEVDDRRVQDSPKQGPHRFQGQLQPLSGESSLALPGEEVTTLMIRNIPCRLEKTDVSTAIDDMGFEGCYDFLHIPKKARPAVGGNLGYGFINFTTPEAAAEFVHLFQGYRFPGRSEKVADVRPAHVQGLADNLGQFGKKSSKFADDRCRRQRTLCQGYDA